MFARKSIDTPQIPGVKFQHKKHTDFSTIGNETEVLSVPFLIKHVKWSTGKIKSTIPFWKIENNYQATGEEKREKHVKAKFIII